MKRAERAKTAITPVKTWRLKAVEINGVVRVLRDGRRYVKRAERQAGGYRRRYSGNTGSSRRRDFED